MKVKGKIYIKSKQKKSWSFDTKIKDEDLVDFISKLSICLESNIQLLDSLEICKETKSKDVQQLLNKSIKYVKNGQPFYNSLLKSDIIVPRYVVKLIQIGEESGELIKVSSSLANELESKLKFKKKIKQALSYPTLIFSFSIFAVLFLLYFIVPTFADMYADYGAELPALTQFTLSISNWIEKYIGYILGFVTIVLFALRYLRKNSRWYRYLEESVIDYLPVIGVLQASNRELFFFRNIQILLDSGMTVLESLQLIKNTSVSLFLEKQLNKLIRDVKKGKSFTNSLKYHKIFDTQTIAIIKVGEESANLAKVFKKITENKEKDMENLSGSLTSLIEPIVIIFLGIIIGFILISLYYPMFQMMNVIQ